MAVVVFDINQFRESYPEFSKVTDAQLLNNFAIAELFLDNTDGSPVKSITERTTLLYLLVAHLSALGLRGMGTLGIQSSAHEGSVSTSFSIPSNWDWYQQTQYGWLYWRLTLKYRIGGRYFAFIET